MGVYEGVTTSELDELAAETAAAMTTTHPDYAIVSATSLIGPLSRGAAWRDARDRGKEGSDTAILCPPPAGGPDRRVQPPQEHPQVLLGDVSPMICCASLWASPIPNSLPAAPRSCKIMFSHMNPKNGEKAPLLADDVYEVIMSNAERLDSEIHYDRDFDYDYFGFRTLERSYLLRVNGKVVERPQHMLMRVAVGIHKQDIDSAVKTYHLMSERWFTHASPTLFNAGTPRPQLSSCFLICMKDDSIEGIYDTLKECAVISKSAGGIGLAAHCIRAVGSYIRGTNGTSNGIIPMLRVFNDTARYVDQGGGKRKGAFAVYLEPWHADIFDWLDLRKNHGKEEARARDLFYGLWVNDLFMRRVEANEDWSLFCPNEAPGLADVWGEEFDALYTKYENEGRAKRRVKAQQLWFAILEAQIETGEGFRGIFLFWGRGALAGRTPDWPPPPHLPQATRTCCTRTRATARATSRTWAPSSRPTSALRSSSTPRRTRPPSATSPRSRCPGLCGSGRTAPRTLAWPPAPAPASSSGRWAARAASSTLSGWPRSRCRSPAT